MPTNALSYYLKIRMVVVVDRWIECNQMILKYSCISKQFFFIFNIDFQMQRKWNLSSVELWTLLNHFSHQGLVNILLLTNNLWKQSTWFPKCFTIFIHKLLSTHCPLPAKNWHHGIWFLPGKTARPARLSWRMDAMKYVLH